jgi:hypothetical protein
MQKFDWENRYIGDNGSQCLVSVDGMDFAIMEPKLFSTKWYSHKMNGPGLQDKIKIAI